MNTKFLLFLVAVILAGCGSDTTTNQVKSDNQPDDSPQVFECHYNTLTSSLGVGLVQLVQEYEQPTIKIYNDSLLSDLDIEWALASDVDYHEQPFCAKFHEPDYYHLEFVCIDVLENAYKILINESDIKYVPKNDMYQFTTWEDYLKYSFGVRPTIDSEGKSTIVERLYHQPSETASFIELPDERSQHFCVREVKGEWIEAIYDCFYNRELNTHETLNCSAYVQKCDDVTIGWMKWREGNNLLIDVLLRP